MDFDLFNIKKQKPLVRYGILVIIVIVWYSIIYSPINSKIEAKKTEIEKQQLQIQKIKRRLKRLGDIEKKLQIERKKLANLKKGLVPGNTIQMVSTNIQDAFLKEAAKEDINVQVYRSGTPRKWRNYKLAVSIFNIRTDIKQFVEFLGKLYSSKRLQRLNNVSISTVRGKEQELRINMEIEALFLGEKAKL